MSLILTAPTDDDNNTRPNQRRRFDPPGTRLRKKILTLVDAGFVAPETEISEIVSLTVQNSSDDFVRDTFNDLVLSLALEQPCKVVFVAAAVVGVNAKAPEVVKELLGKTETAINRAVKKGDWRVVKLGLRFLGALQGIFEGEGVLAVLEELFQRAVDLQSQNPEEVRFSDDCIGDFADVNRRWDRSWSRSFCLRFRT